MGNTKKSTSSFFTPLAAFMLSLVAIGAQAQDDGISSFDLQNPTLEVVEHENKTSRNLVVTRDSLQISDFYQKPKVAERKTTTSESNDENDALSLNFLFYIIENYKFSDLVGE